MSPSDSGILFLSQKKAAVVLLHRLNCYCGFCLLFPGRNGRYSYFVLCALVLIMKPLRHETDLVLSNTEWEGKIFRRDNLLFFNTCGGISFKQGFWFVAFFSDVASGLTCPLGSGIFTLLNVVLYCGITKKAKRNVV